MWFTAIYAVLSGPQWLAAQIWAGYVANRDNIVPIATFLGAMTIAWAALKQAKTASLRHTEQTNADRERRITESFAKAGEQLSSDKLETRLIGIYTLERVSRESEREYWPIMETLTAYVREHAPWPPKGPAKARPSKGRGTRLNRRASWPQPRRLQGVGPTTDIQAILTVLGRRDKTARKQDQSAGRRLDLTATDLRGAHLERAHLEGVNLEGANLKEAYLWGADLWGACLGGASLYDANLARAALDDADLSWADLAEASLVAAHLERANLQVARLVFANFSDAHLEGANLRSADLEHAKLAGAHLEGAILGDDVRPLGLTGVRGLNQEQVNAAYGNEATELPAGLTRPAHWPSVKPDAPDNSRSPA